MKLTKEQYLLNCLSEECAEVIQRVTKALRFGLLEVQDGQELTNAQRLVYEYNDLLGVVEILTELGTVPIDGIGDRGQIDAKKDKLLKFMEHSRNAGILED